MSRVFFTADQHFDHEGIIRICQRKNPYTGQLFSNVAEMNKVMIELWNDVVSPRDIVYCLGDFAHHSNAESSRKIFGKLNGQKHLLIGNHDKEYVRELPWGTPAEHMKFKTVDGISITMCHYGLVTWPGFHNGSISLYGHSHGNLAGTDRRLDVGVDCWNFMPVDLEMILERMKTLPPHWGEDKSIED